MRFKPRSLYASISMLMLTLVALVYGALVAYQTQAAEKQMLRALRSDFERIAQHTSASIEAELRPARLALAMMASTGLLSDERESQRLQALPIMAAALNGNPAIPAVFGATAQGSFLLLRKLDEGDARARVQAPESARFAAQSVDRSGGGLRAAFLYFDAELQLIERRERLEYDFEPRSRPWFEPALRRRPGQVGQTAPYVFFTTGEVGLTLATATVQGGGVVGVDVGLRALQDLLAGQRITPSTELALLSPTGELLASHPTGASAHAGRHVLSSLGDVGPAVLKALWGQQLSESAWQGLHLVEGRQWAAERAPLADSTAAPMTLLLTAPRDELQADRLATRERSLWVTAGLMLLVLPVVHVFARRLAKPLRQVEKQMGAIQRFDFSGADPPRSSIREVDRLALGMAELKHTLGRVVGICHTLGAELDVDSLMARLLAETLAAVGAQAGVLLRASEDGERALVAASSLPNPAGSLLHLALPDATAQTLLSWDEPQQMATHGEAFRHLQAGRLRLVMVPIRTPQGELVGGLGLYFVMNDREAQPPPLEPERLHLVEALAGVAAAAIERHSQPRA